MKDVNGLIENGVDVKKSLELFGDMNTYDTIVHSLKSDCRYFGINRLADMFYDH